MVQIIWTNTALDWLRRIHDYIAKDSPSAAQRVVNGIYEKSLLLKSFPRLGYRFEEIDDREVRILLYGHYQIAYQIESDDEIRILGVFHAAMNLGEILF